MKKNEIDRFESFLSNKTCVRRKAQSRCVRTLVYQNARLEKGSIHVAKNVHPDYLSALVNYESSLAITPFVLTETSFIPRQEKDIDLPPGFQTKNPPVSTHLNEESEVDLMCSEPPLGTEETERTLSSDLPCFEFSKLKWEPQIVTMQTTSLQIDRKITSIHRRNLEAFEKNRALLSPSICMYSD